LEEGAVEKEASGRCRSLLEHSDEVVFQPYRPIRRKGVLAAEARDHPLAGLGDLPLVLELKLELFNYLGQPLSRKGVCGLQGEPASLLQLSFQYPAPHACHLGAPNCPKFSKMFTGPLTIR
jgi:hypothetical protein